MPIFYQQDIDEDTKVGIWKIEEDEHFFLQKAIPQRNVTHPHKKLQHLAGRYLLSYLFPDFPIELIKIADTRKPFLEDEAFHFSISHCGDYAAAIVSVTKRVGVDSEIPSDKIEKIQNKFVSPKELKVLDGNFTQQGSLIFKSSNSQILKLTYAWSCKEAVFKWYGLGGVDFKGHMEITSIIPDDDQHTNTILLFKKHEELFLNLCTIFFDDLCLTYVVT
ncbi:MAG: 4'-phosphopantetheinyl transferase family protein [Flavisolibacter sp.]